MNSICMGKYVLNMVGDRVGLLFNSKISNEIQVMVVVLSDRNLY